MSLFSILRKNYTAGKGLLIGLPTDVEERDPVILFSEWFAEARKSRILLPDAMCLATSTSQGQPSARMVLLKKIENRAIVFYTNYASHKAEELDHNPRAAAVIHWAVLQRQIRIVGSVIRLDRASSRTYFNTRNRGSQIGAWASQQSRPLARRAELEQQEKAIRLRFRDQDRIPLPDFWGGYRIHIDTIEFWQGRANRLHDRIRFDWGQGSWETTRLYP